MLLSFFIVLSVIAAAYGLYKRLDKTTTSAPVSSTGLSAFARIAEAEGKILAAKAKTDIQKAEAKALHAVQDEIEKLLG